MNIVKGLFIFVSGAAVGGGLTYFVVNKKLQAKYDEMYQKEKEGFDRMAKQLENDCMAASINLNKEVKEKVNEGINQYIIDHNEYESDSEEPEEGATPVRRDPEIIKPEEFDEFCDDENWNEPVSLYMTADGVIFDDDENKVEEPDLLLVPDIGSHFGEYEEDSVYVRNYETRTDYEILRSLKTWKEVEDHRNSR